MVDEVGDENLQKEDGNAGEKKIMVVNEMRAQVRNSSKDNHAMVIGFTASNRHPTMCDIIITASKLKVTYVTGFNPLSDDGQDVCGK
jgi:hypothetical protein